MSVNSEEKPILSLSGKYKVTKVNKKISGALRKCKVGDILEIKSNIYNINGGATKSDRDDSTSWTVIRYPKNPKEEKEIYDLTPRIIFGTLTGFPPAFDLTSINVDRDIKEFCEHLCLMKDDGVTCPDCPLYKKS